MLSTGEDLSDKDAQVMIDMADADGDGRVSFEEFKRFLSD
jgi:Ca2+-binding EF-hand superfamily protein